MNKLRHLGFSLLCSIAAQGFCPRSESPYSHALTKQALCHQGWVQHHLKSGPTDAAVSLAVDFRRNFEHMQAASCIAIHDMIVISLYARRPEGWLQSETDEDSCQRE